LKLESIPKLAIGIHGQFAPGIDRGIVSSGKKPTARKALTVATRYFKFLTLFIPICDIFNCFTSRTAY
jgi:hypothetical protein